MVVPQCAFAGARCAHGLSNLPSVLRGEHVERRAPCRLRLAGRRPTHCQTLAAHRSRAEYRLEDLSSVHRCGQPASPPGCSLAPRAKAIARLAPRILFCGPFAGAHRLGSPGAPSAAESAGNWAPALDLLICGALAWHRMYCCLPLSSALACHKLPSPTNARTWMYTWRPPSLAATAGHTVQS